LDAFLGKDEVFDAFLALTAAFGVDEGPTTGAPEPSKSSLSLLPPSLDCAASVKDNTTDQSHGKNST